MGQREKRGTQQHGIILFAGSVETVADDRRVKTERVGAVNSELVGSAGQGSLAEAGTAGIVANSLPPRECFPAVDWIIDLIRAVVRPPAGHRQKVARLVDDQDGAVAAK
jgi:hypothetical protein